MTDGPTRAIIFENGVSAYSVTIRVSGHEFHGDEPVSFGGADTAPAPYDYLIAALGECTAMTVRWYAVQQEWPLESVEVTITHRKEPIEGSKHTRDIFDKAVLLRGPSLTDEQRRRLIDVAGKCPIQRTLESDPEIVTRAATEE